MESSWRSGRSRKRRIRVWLIIAVIVATVVGVLVALTVRATLERRRLADEQYELQQRAAEPVGTLIYEPVPLDAPESAELLDLLKRVPIAARDGALDDIMDWPRLMGEILSRKNVPPLSAYERGRLKDNIRGYIAPVFADWADRCELRRIRVTGDQREAVVVAAHSFETQRLLFRWWLTRRDGRWRVNDFDSMRADWRLSRFVASSLQAKAAGLAEDTWNAFVDAVDLAFEATAAGDADRAVDILQGVSPTGMPDVNAARYWLLMGAARVRQSRPEEALECLDKAEGLNPDIPLIAGIRAMALNKLARHEEAERVIRPRLAQLGDAGDACGVLGTALGGQGRYAEAMAAYRRALAVEPDTAGSLAGLAILLPVNRKDEVREHIARMAHPGAAFERIVRPITDAGDFEALEVVLDAYEPIVGDLPKRQYYIAVLLFYREQYQSAAAILTEAIPRIEVPEGRQACYLLLIEALVAAGKPIEAYEAYPSRERGFAAVAGLLTERADADGLAAVLDAYGEYSETDPWLLYYRGEHRLLGQEYEQAYQAFTIGLSMVLNDRMTGPFHARRVYSLYRLGRWNEAYQRVGLRRDTFNQLASLMMSDQDGAGLAALVEAHQAVRPDDGELEAWAARADLLVGEPMRAIERLLAGYERILASGRELTPELLVGTMVRALLRLRLVDKALHEAKTFTEASGDPIFEAIVYAATDDRRLTDELLARTFRPGFGPQEFLDDPDVPEVTTIPALQVLRIKYAPPTP